MKFKLGIATLASIFVFAGSTSNKQTCMLEPWYCGYPPPPCPWCSN